MLLLSWHVSTFDDRLTFPVSRVVLLRLRVTPWRSLTSSDAANTVGPSVAGHERAQRVRRAAFARFGAGVRAVTELSRDVLTPGLGDVCVAVLG